MLTLLVLGIAAELVLIASFVIEKLARDQR